MLYRPLQVAVIMGKINGSVSASSEAGTWELVTASSLDHNKLVPNQRAISSIK